MAPQEQWILSNGDSLAAVLDTHREMICTTLSSRLAASYPLLCYDHARFDGRTFQKMMMRRTPQRLHTLIQTALRTNNLALIEREYAWAWPLVQRFGANRQHMIAQMYWYFDVVRTTIELDQADRAALMTLEKAAMQMVERATMPQPDRTAS